MHNNSNWVNGLDRAPFKNQERKGYPAYYYKLGRFITGTTLGFPIASIAIFYLDKLYIGSEANRLFYTGITYFVSVAVVIAFSMFRKKDYLTVRYLFLFSAVGCLFLPLVNSLKTETNFLKDLSANQAWAWVDFSFLLTAGILFLVSYYLPKQRTEEPKAKKRMANVISV